MTGIVTVIGLALALLTALFAGIQALRDRAISDAHLAASAPSPVSCSPASDSPNGPE